MAAEFGSVAAPSSKIIYSRFQPSFKCKKLCGRDCGRWFEKTVLN